MPEPQKLVVPAFVFGLEPKAAVAWFEAKGHRISWNWQDTAQEANARAFTVAKVTRLDLLKDIRSAVTTALKEGKTEAWFIKELQPVLQAKGWWGKSVSVNPEDLTAQLVQLGSHQRLRTIFRTNLQSAYMAGRWTDMIRNTRDRPYWMYVAVLDSRTRPTHAAMNGRVYRFDDAVWQTHYPPCGFNCRCRVRALSERQRQKLNFKVNSSDGQLVQKTVDTGLDPRTGEIYEADVTGIKLDNVSVRVAKESGTIKIPRRRKDGSVEWVEGPTKILKGQVLKGKPHPGEPRWERDLRKYEFYPDAGFNYNPGRAHYLPDLEQYAPDTARQWVEGLLTGPEFARWYKIWDTIVARDIAARPNIEAAVRIAQLRKTASTLTYPVAVLPESIQRQIGAKTRVVMLSGETLAKQLVKRADTLPLEDYWRVQGVLEKPDAVIAEGESHLLFYRLDEKVYMAVVKTTQNKAEVYLQSFRRATEGELAKALANSQRIK